MTVRIVCLLFLAALATCQRQGASTPTPAVPAEISQVMQVRRPEGGETFGLYLIDKKVGFLFTDVRYVRGRKDQVESVNQFIFKANVGNKVSERILKETRVYEAKPNGRLLSFLVEQHGDGGEQVLEASATPTGMRVIRKRPGQANQVLNLPPSKERVEDADQPRLALLRGAKMEGVITDGQDLGHYRVSTEPGGTEDRLLAGVRVRLSKTTTLSEKEKVPVDSYISESGEVVEMRFGATMRAVAEPEPVARRLDQVEVFGLTRVVLPRALPENARKVPGQLKLVLTGLPAKFQKSTARRAFRALSDGRVELTLTARAPKDAAAALPLSDPAGGEYLKNSIIIETDHPEIVRTAKTVVGGATNAYQAARRIVAWVGTTLEKSYGASSDRASDVLRARKGDCTEHSLLAVSLMRASGIPARRIDGLVYMVNEDQVPALYWHEWVEAYVGEWTQMDPTFNQMVADPTHLGLGEEGNAEITALIGQLKVLDIQ